MRRGQINGHWALFSTGWRICPVGKSPRGATIWQVKAPNGRRWRSDGSIRRRRMVEFADACTRAQLCKAGSKLGQDITCPIPKGLFEVEQRRCRDCGVLKPSGDYQASSDRSCDVCVRTRTSGHHAVDCPTCHERVANEHLSMILGKGWGCRLCQKEAAVVRVVAPAALPLVKPKSRRVTHDVDASPATFERFDRARAAIDAAFG